MNDLKHYAAHYLDSATIGGVIDTLFALESFLLRLCEKEGLDPPKFDAGEFLISRRKFHMHALLESLEGANPELAAQLQSYLEDSSMVFPFRYE